MQVKNIFIYWVMLKPLFALICINKKSRHLFTTKLIIILFLDINHWKKHPVLVGILLILKVKIILIRWGSFDENSQVHRYRCSLKSYWGLKNMSRKLDLGRLFSILLLKRSQTYFFLQRKFTWFVLISNCMTQNWFHYPYHIK